MSIKQFPNSSTQVLSTNNVHPKARTRPSAAATRSPSIVGPRGARLQNRTAMPPRRSPSRPTRNFRSVSSSALTSKAADTPSKLASQMQLLNVSSPIGKKEPKRAASASKLIAPQQPPRLPAGTFRRRPAHLQALDASKRNKDCLSNMTTLRSQAKDSSQQLRKTLSSLCYKLDFVVLDKYSRSKGEEGLKPLCQQLEQLNYLAQSFCRLVSAHDLCRPSHSGKGTNSIQIKSFIVSLQAIADKLPTEIEADAAARVVEVIDQGLLEQMLSWVGEVEATYDAVRGSCAVRTAPSTAQPPPRQGVRPENIRRRALGIGEKRSSAMLSSESPRSDVSDGSDGSWAYNGLSSAREERRRERMQRHRPSRILIPESSFERKTRSRQ